ncbi:CGNR zinc finger domain-containing protein [Actinoplanes sp. LDG1-01]|uniref:CGNR zinc finger domain-containing protein n=2 Tax=Paractinoplanes lichenicola TaxID=2802976 RepID=A0ABS1W072_9ACTN|nr:CGNR zinc finger domain-containing protein [Actinoplanes lichenicola]
MRTFIRQLAWGNNGVVTEQVAAPPTELALRAEFDGDQVSLRPATAEASTDLISAAALTALIRAMARPGWARFKACRALDCGWVFVDTSRNGSRRWCDMGDCGNRAKGAAFRARARTAQ